jgi:hypothetical protein
MLIDFAKRIHDVCGDKGLRNIDTDITSNIMLFYIEKLHLENHEYWKIIIHQNK